jgi:hypothetical protein
MLADLYLCSFMYYSSRKDYSNSDTSSKNDYDICTVWIFMATFGPFLIQYASLMKMLYHKGVFS